MPDFKMERDAVLRRWYGGNPQHRDPSPRRNPEEPIRDNDYLGIPVQTNTPFLIFGKCLVWKYGLNQDGYGYLRTDGKVQLAHRLAYAQAYGQILDGTQINHLCNRPYCLQPAHLYAGTHQDNKDDERVFGMEDGQLTIAPILMAPEKQFENQLLSRLQQSARFRGNVVVWEAPLQPPPGRGVCSRPRAMDDETRRAAPHGRKADRTDADRETGIAYVMIEGYLCGRCSYCWAPRGGTGFRPR